MAEGVDRRLDALVMSPFLGAVREPAHRPGDSGSIPPREEQVGGAARHAHAALCLLQHRRQELPAGRGGRQPGPERRGGSPVCLRLLAVAGPSPGPGACPFTLDVRRMGCSPGRQLLSAATGADPGAVPTPATSKPCQSQNAVQSTDDPAGPSLPPSCPLQRVPTYCSGTGEPWGSAPSHLRGWL